ncbi:hypothetical protein QAD02_005730 [Eretmocerus hayati]|uniref:Uncharacterized protein n=1 Tax=Eretmocerus hayati TaxID=131215 RepID=A0ACC2NTB9_9HYME|nr:hypothetical protein QAD02_005730 [Eretmocerus hayati]
MSQYERQLIDAVKSVNVNWYSIMDTPWELQQINCADHNGYTPLAIAMVRRQGRVVSWLLSIGADVNAKDKYGRNGLHLALLNALRHGMQDYIFELLQKYPRPDTIYSYSASYPLILAVAMGNCEIIKFLYKCGVNIDMTTKVDDPTPLLRNETHRIPGLGETYRRYWDASIAELEVLGQIIIVLQVSFKDIVEYKSSNEILMERKFRLAAKLVDRDHLPPQIQIFRDRLLNQISKMKRQLLLIERMRIIMSHAYETHFEMYDNICENIFGNMSLENVRTFCLAGILRKNLEIRQ